MAIHVLIASAGFGQRYGSLIPKQYTRILNKTILEHTISTFLKSKLIDSIYVISAPTDTQIEKLHFFNDKRIKLLKCGGVKRANSIKNALSEIDATNNDWIMIHDAARPLVTIEDINLLIEQTSSKDAGFILVSKVVDTLKVVKDNIIKKTLNRGNIYHALTPQMFRFKELFEAYNKLDIDKYTDDAEIMENFGFKIKIILGKKNNIKITYPEDVEFLEFILKKQHGNKI